MPKSYIKLDKRFNGHNFFRYAASFNSLQSDKFCDVRNWCWEQWGPSSEYEYWRPSRNPAWCWISDDYKLRILLADSKELQWYLLKWT